MLKTETSSETSLETSSETSSETSLRSSQMSRNDYSRAKTIHRPTPTLMTHLGMTLMTHLGMTLMTPPVHFL